MQPSADAHTARLLLVGTDRAMQEAARAAASQLGASLDTVPDSHEALTRMLRHVGTYTCVLAVAPLTSQTIDALAGMLDEVTQHPTPLLLLGCASCSGANTVQCLAEVTADTIVAALCRPALVPSGQSPLTADELVSALHCGGLRMRFQPIVGAADLEPIGLEALARVHTKQRGILHPKDFIPATLACGRERVLTSIAAARTFLELRNLVCLSHLFVSINLPVASVLNPGSLTRAVELCAVAKVSPSQVMLELLESRQRPDVAALHAALEAWRDAGFRTAIDDAGPELPHWRNLLDLPFDVVKLDGNLIADPASGELLTAIVTEAKNRCRFVVAEGIETQAHLDRARALGVDALQGFLFARPLPALAVPLWLDQHASQIAAAHAGIAA